MKLFSFRNFRVLFLLALLFAAAIYTKAQHLDSTSWVEPLEIVVYPINGDDREETVSYINKLSDRHFAAIDQFTASQAKLYAALTATPTRTRLGLEIGTKPPKPPALNASLWDKLTWSLRLRYWAWKNTPKESYDHRRVRMFVTYYQGEEGKALQHSLGLRKGLLGLVHAFADPQQTAQNNIVIAHEFMHTVGATDKYSPDGQPVFPDGYAFPDKTPLYPQYRAEIMAARLPLSAEESQMAYSLASCVVGKKTAAEIHWIRGP